MVLLSFFLRQKNLANGSQLGLKVPIIIQTTKKVKPLVKKWNQSESLAVDVECHNHPNGRWPGAVTVKDTENSYLLRTGINQQLMYSLKGVIENPKVTKVMHGAGHDVECFRRSGIRLANLHDTCVAYGVLNKVRNQIGLNDLLERHDLPPNPYSKTHGKAKPRTCYFKPDDLPEKLQLYCFYDVEHLLKLQTIQNRELKDNPEANSEFQQKCESLTSKGTKPVNLTNESSPVRDSGKVEKLPTKKSEGNIKKKSNEELQTKTSDSGKGQKKKKCSPMKNAGKVEKLPKKKTSNDVNKKSTEKVQTTVEPKISGKEKKKEKRLTSVSKSDTCVSDKSDNPLPAVMHKFIDGLKKRLGK